MKAFLYVVSVLWIALGSCFVLYTIECRKTLVSLLRGVDRRFLAFLPAIFGILFIVAASHTRNPGFIRLLGLLAVAEGAFMFVNPQGLYGQVAEWFLDKASDQTYRFFGIISLILGTAVLSWIL
jgi:uncharacterized protein YjeT (DUF2065 family)